jgi:hypothetical protein
LTTCLFCLFVRLSICSFARLSICSCVSLAICLFVYLSFKANIYFLIKQLNLPVKPEMQKTKLKAVFHQHCLEGLVRLN